MNVELNVLFSFVQCICSQEVNRKIIQKEPIFKGLLQSLLVGDTDTKGELDKIQKHYLNVGTFVGFLNKIQKSYLVCTLCFCNHTFIRYAYSQKMESQII